jgi:hypothetical protein
MTTLITDYEHSFVTYLDNIGDVTVAYDYIEPEPEYYQQEDWDFAVFDQYNNVITYDIPRKQWLHVYAEVKELHQEFINHWNEYT